MLIGAAVFGGLVGGIAASLAIAGLLWNRDTGRSANRLHTRSGSKAPFSRDDLAGLPAPVVRYFEFALAPGQPLVSYARFRQVGDFALRAHTWTPFTASEFFSVDPPGFLWNAKIRIAPLISIFIHDGYSAGEGAMYGKLAGVFPVVDQHGTHEMASGELLRYLAEGVLLPTALLARDGISWTPLDDMTARATLTDGATTVSCDVHFTERGDIVRICAMRYRDADGKPVLTPWVGHWRDYRRVSGMMIPMSGDVEWVLPAGPLSYWRGRIIDARYEFATTA